MKSPSLSCASCEQPMPGKYCAHCGEKRLEPQDHSMRRFAEHAVASLAHLDGKILHTLRTLLRHPGRLTADFLRGRRKPYVPPLEIFLIGNLVFFLLHPLIGSNTLTTDLNTHLHYTWHHAVAEAFITPRLAARALTADAYALVFNPASVTQAKSFVLLLVPIFSLAVVTLYWRDRRSYGAHLIFAVHFVAFWLLMICATLALTNLAVRLLRAVSIFPSAAGLERCSTAFTLAIMTAYLFVAVRAVFSRESNVLTAVKALALAIALDLSLQIYRLVLFFITFWST